MGIQDHTTENSAFSMACGIYKRCFAGNPICTFESWRQALTENVLSLAKQGKMYWTWRKSSAFLQILVFSDVQLLYSLPFRLSHWAVGWLTWCFRCKRKVNERKRKTVNFYLMPGGEKKKQKRDFPGDSVVKTHCKGCGFHLWSGN